MGYICLECYEEYDKDGLNLEISDAYNYKCPKITCGEFAVVEIDDLILPIIKELNMKGYYTKFCCSNHSYYYNQGQESGAYIAFVKDYVPIIACKGWKFDKKDDMDNMVCMRKTFINPKTELELHMKILKSIEEMIKWVEGLEFCEEC